MIATRLHLGNLSKSALLKQYFERTRRPSRVACHCCRCLCRCHRCHRSRHLCRCCCGAGRWWRPQQRRWWHPQQRRWWRPRECRRGGAKIWDAHRVAGPQHRWFGWLLLTLAAQPPVSTILNQGACRGPCLVFNPNARLLCRRQLSGPGGAAAPSCRSGGPPTPGGLKPRAARAR